MYVQVVAEQRPPSTSAAGSGQAYDSAVSVGSTGLQVVEGLAVLAAVPAILTAREFCRGWKGWKGCFWCRVVRVLVVLVVVLNGVAASRVGVLLSPRG